MRRRGARATRVRGDRLPPCAQTAVCRRPAVRLPASAFSGTNSAPTSITTAARLGHARSRPTRLTPVPRLQAGTEKWPTKVCCRDASSKRRSDCFQSQVRTGSAQRVPELSAARLTAPAACGMNMAPTGAVRLRVCTIVAAPGITANPTGDNLRYFQVIMEGPQGSPYESGIFKLELFLTEEYPMAPPKVRTRTPLARQFSGASAASVPWAPMDTAHQRTTPSCRQTRVAGTVFDEDVPPEHRPAGAHLPRHS